MMRDPGERMRLGATARREYEARYTPETNYRTLMGTYRLALQRAGGPLPEIFRSFPPASVPGDTSVTAADRMQ